MLVMWHPGTPASDDALRHHLANLGYADAQVGRLCPQCGSDAHGRPWARAGGVLVSVSISRSGPHVLTAVSPRGAVGVDVESVGDVARRWDPAVVLAPGETVGGGGAAEEQAAVWVGKEAVLKAWGVGLERAMTSFRLGEVVDAIDLSPLAAPTGFAAAVALTRR